MAATFERRVQKFSHAITGGLDADYPAAKRDAIGIIMLTGQPRHQAAGHQRTAGAGNAVDGDRNADAGAADAHAQVGGAGGSPYDS